MTTGPPIIPPPPDLKPICDKLAEYVARNGNQFEENIRAKNDPRYDAPTCLQILLFVEIANHCVQTMYYAVIQSAKICGIACRPQ
jgi:hypothetical protein